MNWFDWVCPFDNKLGNNNKEFIFNRQLISSIFEYLSHSPNKEFFPKVPEKQMDEILNCCWRVCDCAITGKINSNNEFISMLFFNIIKNHYLVDGNKRTGVWLCLFCVYCLNQSDVDDAKHHNLNVNTKKLELLAKDVAKGTYRNYQNIFEMLGQIIA